MLSALGAESQKKWRQKVIAFLTETDVERKENSLKGAVMRAIEEMKKASWKSALIKELAAWVNQEREAGGLDTVSPKLVGNILDSLNYISAHQRRGNATPLVELPEGEKPAPVPAFRPLPVNVQVPERERVNV